MSTSSGASTAMQLVALPDPAQPEAAAQVSSLVAAVALRTPRDGVHTQLFLRWPAADSAMHPLLERAGLVLDAVWADRPVRAAPSVATEIEVRRATSADAEVVGDLVTEEVRHHLPLTLLTRDLPVVRSFTRDAVSGADPSVLVTVAERDRAVVGYAVCRIVDTPDDGLVRSCRPGRAAHLLSVGVRANVRGAGVERALVAATEDAATARGVRRISAAWVPTNPLADRFWPRRGLRPVWHCYAAHVPTW